MVEMTKKTFILITPKFHLGLNFKPFRLVPSIPANFIKSQLEM